MADLFCPEPAVCEVTRDQYLNRIAADLPKGPIWDISDPDRNFTKVIVSLADIFTVYQNERCSIFNELDPCLAVKNVKRWAVIFGFPFECMPDADADVLCQYITLVMGPCAGPTIQFYTSLLTLLGVEGVSITESLTLVGRAGCLKAGCAEAGNFDECPSEIIIDANANQFQTINGFRHIPAVECIKRCFIPANMDVIYAP